jgi:hypothetical protein
VIVIENAFLAVWFWLSETATVKFAVPAAVGVPEIVPAALRVSPAGSEPVTTDHWYGLTPPDASSVML